MIRIIQKTLKVTMALAACFGALSTSAAAEIKAVTPGNTFRWAPVLGVSSFAMKAEGYEVGAQGGLVVGLSTFMGLGNPALDGEFGLQFMQTGGVQKGYLADGTYMENELTMSYLTIPLGVRWKFAPWGDQPNSALYLKGGLIPAFLMSSKQKVSALGMSLEKDIKSDTNSFDLMAQVGLGGSYELGNGQDLLLDLMYVHGTSKVLKAMSSTNEGLVASISYSMAL